MQGFTGFCREVLSYPSKNTKSLSDFRSITVYVHGCASSLMNQNLQQDTLTSVTSSNWSDNKNWDLWKVSWASALIEPKNITLDFVQFILLIRLVEN